MFPTSPLPTSVDKTNDDGTADYATREQTIARRRLLPILLTRRRSAKHKGLRRCQRWLGRRHRGRDWRCAGLQVEPSVFYFKLLIYY